MEYLSAFVASGILCLVAQILLVNTPLGFVNVLVACICTGVVITFLGLMDPITHFGGGGIIVSIMDAGEGIFSGMYHAFSGTHAPFFPDQPPAAWIIAFIVMVSCVFITGIVVGLAKPLQK